MSVYKVELADILRRFAGEYAAQYHPNGYHQRVLRAIEACRTSALGGHVDRCNSCGHIRIGYNSCRNRHCPKCQGIQQQKWVMARQADLLPVGYFHMVFTLPDTLNPLCLKQPALMYDLLFRAVRDTLFSFAADPKHLGAETGFIAVLHTWGQTLTLHPHLHCIIPAGGLAINGLWRKSRAKGSFLFPVKALSMVFRAKYLQYLKESMGKNSAQLTPEALEALYGADWVVYAKAPFAGPGHVISYLGSYTHRVAISNHRLVSLDGDRVTFRWRDYRDGNRTKLMTLHAVEFLRRFCLHILPYRFVKIRHYGILSSRRKPELRALRSSMTATQESASDATTARMIPWQQVCIIRMGFDPDKCPCCGKGRMVRIDILPPCDREPPRGNDATQRAPPAAGTGLRATAYFQYLHVK